MKNIILLVAITIALGMVSCVKDEVYKTPPAISEAKHMPASATPNDDVVISATIKAAMEGNTIETVVLKWTLGGAAQTDIPMTANAGVYSATIPKQADGAVVEYTITATDNKGLKSNFTGKYIVSNIVVDYSKLVMNEVDPNSKAVELHNVGSEIIPLVGLKLVKDGNNDILWWTGSVESGEIAAGGYVVIIQNNLENPALSGSGGISGKKDVKFELLAPAGDVLSSFERIGTTDVTPSSFQRCPNGTGDWKIATPTNGAKNPDTGEDIP